MPVSHRRFNLMKINEYLKKVEEAKNQDAQIVTENTNMSKFKIPDHVKKPAEESTYVSSVKQKK